MSTSHSDLRKRLANTRASGLRVRARELASGWAGGTHRAERKGAGVEFAGHRAYTPGDDLRHLDRHALLRHKQLLIREFLTDTERGVHLVVDASGSMNYRSQGPPTPASGKAVSESKAERALLLAAALAFVARGAGDPVGLTWLTDTDHQTLKPRVGGEAFERVLYHLEALDEDAQGSSSQKTGTATPSPVNLVKLYATLGAQLPRGTVVYVLSDFLDAEEAVCRALGALCTQRRTVRAAQVLTVDEVLFPFEGSLRFQDPESLREVETDAGSVRAAYQEALAVLTERVRASVEAQGGVFLRTTTDSPADTALLSLTRGETRQGEEILLRKKT